MFDFKVIMNNIKNLEWKKYFYKNLLICFAVIFFVFFIITVTLTKSYTGVVNNELNRYCMEIVFNAKNGLDKAMDTLSDSYAEFVGGSCVNDINIMIHSEDITTEYVKNSILNIKNIASVYNRDTGYVDSIYFYFSKSGYVISNNAYFASGFRDMITDNQWIDNYEKYGKAVSARAVKSRKVNKSYFTVIKPINITGNDLIAYNIDIDKFLSSINNDVREFYIIDKKGDILYSTDTELSEKNISNTGKKGIEIQEALKNPSVGIKSADNMIFNSAETDDGSYKIVLGIDATHYNNQLDKIKITMLLIMLPVALVTVILAFFIVSEFYNNILDLVLVIDGKKRNDKGSLREVKFVKNKILTMLDKNSKIENELANRVEIVSNTKKKMMQNQLNSHFLYNTLGIISAIDILENKRDTNTVKAITNLSDILRFALNDKSYTAPLSEELEFMKKYLDIQRLRYKDKFDYYEEIDEDILDCNIIKMILQPLVENAVFHGIAPSGKRCFLSIEIHREGEMLKIRVSDNGIGITEEKLAYLREEFANGISSDAKTHGLLSVNQRCMLFYGSEYGCEAECKNGVTSITVKHPILRNHKEDKK